MATSDKELSKSEIAEIKGRLQNARFGLMQHQPFYATLLFDMKYGIDDQCDTAYTTGKKICFNPYFVAELTDSELEFVLMHEVMHVALGHLFRERSAGMDPTIANYAADIVVNSNILYSLGGNEAAITLGKYGVSMHLTPDGEEGYLYSMNEVYDMLAKAFDKYEKKMKALGSKLFDNHDHWGEGGTGDDEDDSLVAQIWQSKVLAAIKIAEDYGKSRKGCGNLPGGIKRLISGFTDPVTDWRTILNDFVQQEVYDYSFNPPDKRFLEGDFLLPDFNDTEEKVKDILFMIDTSGSMSEEDLTEVYSEVAGAINQFCGKLQGWLGFFDAGVVPPQPFDSFEEFKKIEAAGGGGTSFTAIFDYVREHISEIEPAVIIVLTDGYAEYPEESAAMGIPVLWVINNDEVEVPWGKVTRITRQ